MGQAKREQMEWDDRVQDAIRIAIEAGSMDDSCPHEVPVDLLDQEPAFEMAMDKFDHGELPQFADRAEVKRAMEEAFLNVGEECGYCAKNRDE